MKIKLADIEDLHNIDSFLKWNYLQLRKDWLKKERANDKRLIKNQEQRVKHFKKKRRLKMELKTLKDLGYGKLSKKKMFEQKITIDKLENAIK